MSNTITKESRKNSKGGGRRSSKQFEQEQNSIDQQLAFMSPEIQARYYENRRRYYADFMEMERWAASGFMSTPKGAVRDEGSYE